MLKKTLGFPGGSTVKKKKNLSVSAEDLGSMLGPGRSPGGGNGSPLQYSCLGNLRDRGAWWATIPGDAKESDMTERLNNNNTR